MIRDRLTDRVKVKCLLHIDLVSPDGLEPQTFTVSR